MADLRYLQQRRQGWYVRIAVPRELRGKESWGRKSIIVKSLATRDLSKAQKARWQHVEDWTEAFRRAAGEIPLTRAEINDQAWRVYYATLTALEERKVAAPPEADESPEEAGLFIHASAYGDALEDEDWSIVATDIAGVRERTGAMIVEGSETHQLLAVSMIRAKLAAISGRLNYLRDEPTEPPAMFVSGGISPKTLQPVAHIPRPKVGSGKGGPSFKDGAEDFIAELQRDPNAALREQTKRQYEMTFRLFADYSHNASLANIDRGLASGFIETIARLDPSWGRKPGTKDLPLTELLEMYGDGDRQLTNKTLNRHISALHSLFRWLRRNQKFSRDNPFSDQWKKRPDPKKTGWRPFNTDELNKLFGADLFKVTKEERIKPKRHTMKSAMRWVPLIALYSGMRLDEICSLRTDNVQREGDIWFFVVTEDEGQSVKTEAGERKVPVHSGLIRCGFIDYLEALPKGQLFPGLKAGGPDGKFSWQLTQRFTAYRRSVGVTRPRLSFHSFRKNVATALDNAGVAQADVAALLGHERGFSFDRYSGGKDLKALRAIAEKISYQGLNLVHLDIS